MIARRLRRRDDHGHSIGASLQAPVIRTATAAAAENLGLACRVQDAPAPRAGDQSALVQPCHGHWRQQWCLGPGCRQGRDVHGRRAIPWQPACLGHYASASIGRGLGFGQHNGWHGGSHRHWAASPSRGQHGTAPSRRRPISRRHGHGHGHGGERPSSSQHGPTMATAAAAAAATAAAELPGPLQDGLLGRFAQRQSSQCM